VSDASPTPILRGANPTVQLLDGDETVALASVWRVDESPMGAGTALILWHAGRVRAIGLDPGLSSWLSGRFVRHFPRAAGLDWSQVEVRTEEVEVELDLEHGLVARAGDIEVRVDDVMGQRQVTADAFGLDGVDHHLSFLLAPCRRGSITIGGQQLAGEPRVVEHAEQPESTAFLAVDEVWSR
jgi:hypothetical protein